MTYPYLSIDLAKIEHNARVIVGLCKEHGIAVTGVTKAVRGDPDIARAMLQGGVVSIADSRFENLHRLREGGVPEPYLLLRLPPLSGVDQTVELAGISLESEPAVLEALSEAALCRDRVHRVILMVELGDLREGLWPEDLIPLVDEAQALPGIHIAGLGANLACLGGVMPSEANMRRLVDLAEAVEDHFGLRLDWISGINSSGLDLIASGRMPPRVNHARIGEAILLGRETTRRHPWPDTFQDAFRLHAEVLEVKRKPTSPLGERGEDAFGHVPPVEEGGESWRALLNLGRQDVAVEGLTPADPRLRIAGASSDYLVLDVSAAGEGDIKVGTVVDFHPNYAALLAAMTSEYVKKERIGRD